MFKRREARPLPPWATRTSLVGIGAGSAADSVALLHARPPLHPVLRLDGSSKTYQPRRRGQTEPRGLPSRRRWCCVGSARGPGCASSVVPLVGSVRTDLTGRSAGRVCRLGSSAVRSLHRGNIAVRSLHRGNIAVRSLHRGNIAVRSLHRGNIARPCRSASRLAGSAPTAAGGRRDLGSLVHTR